MSRYYCRHDNNSLFYKYAETKMFTFLSSLTKVFSADWLSLLSKPQSAQKFGGGGVSLKATGGTCADAVFPFLTDPWNYEHVHSSCEQKAIAEGPESALGSWTDLSSTQSTSSKPYYLPKHVCVMWWKATKAYEINTDCVSPLFGFVFSFSTGILKDWSFCELRAINKPRLPYLLLMPSVFLTGHWLPPCFLSFHLNFETFISFGQVLFTYQECTVKIALKLT